MIFHEYSEWHEPEKPPFTVEDVIRAIQEAMLRHHVSFDEAMRLLMRQGLPLNSFPQVNGLDALIEKLLKKLDDLKASERKRFDLNGMVGRERQALANLGAQIERELARRGEKSALEAFKRLRSGKRPGDTYRFVQLQWDLEKRQRAGSDKAGNGLEDFGDRLRKLGPIEAFAERENFTGSLPLDLDGARRLAGRFEAIDQLAQDLRDALENGDLLKVDADTVRQMLGQEAGEEFDQKRQELMDQFNKALEQTGLVDTEDGIYKLTPAAARKLGTAFLAQLFSMLKSDGMGKHSAVHTGEGQIESVKTRPYQFGDSLAHLDLPSSLINALVREGAGTPIKVKASDFEVHETVGTARTAITVLIDMSGSMARQGRFYNAKKVALALDALLRSQYPEDKLYFVGFATFAKQYKVGDIMELAPYPVTHFGASIQLAVDFEHVTDPAKKRSLPQYFTNTQKGLELARRLLTREESANRHIILITDGVPTAYYLGPRLKLTYPPSNETFHETLREVRACTDAGITINTFMMTSEWEFDYHGEREFVNKMVAINGGRLFYPSPDSLTQYVLVDYLQHKKQLFGL